MQRIVYDVTLYVRLSTVNAARIIITIKLITSPAASAVIDGAPSLPEECYGYRCSLTGLFRRVVIFYVGMI